LRPLVLGQRWVGSGGVAAALAITLRLPLALTVASLAALVGLVASELCSVVAG
jgi:hypothetical protein